MFWDKYLATDSEFWVGEFYGLRGEKKIQNGHWEKPTLNENKYDKDASEAASLEGRIQQIRKMFVEL